MGCNCKATSNIAYLQRHFGNGKENETESYGFGDILRYIVIVLSIIVSLPFMLIYLIVKLFSKNKEIDIAKLFRIKKQVQYVRE